MSYILEALKKLEGKKRQDSAPSLMTEHSFDLGKPKKKALWPYLIILLFLLNGAVLMAWLKPWTAKPQLEADQLNVVNNPARENTAIDDNQNNDMMHLSASVKDKIMYNAESKEIESPGISAGAVMSPNKNDVNSESIQKSTNKNGNQPPALSADIPDQIGTETASLEFLPKDKELDVLKDKIKDELEISKSGAEIDSEIPVDSVIPDNLNTDQEQEVKEFSQLSESVKKELPELSVSGHIYSDNPSNRIITINGIILREGESVSKGLKVFEITPSGIIFTYKDERFRLRSF